MYLNTATIIGNLTRDPEIKSLPSGVKVTNMSIATNRVWYNEAKEKQESVEYHNIVVFGKQAENVATYLKKGSQALVIGRIQTRSWESDGAKKYATEIVADTVQFGSKAGYKADDVKQQDNQENDYGVKTQSYGNAPVESQNITDDIDPESIPF